MRNTRKALAVEMLVVLVLMTIAYASDRGPAETRLYRARLQAAREAHGITKVSFTELEGLPAPVQRYFRAALREGQPIVTAVRLEQTGSLNIGEAAERWGPARAEQVIITQRPGFDWNAQVALRPGVPIRLHETYIAGEGILHATLLGLASLVNEHDTAQIALGELPRFIAEAVWYPTALLPSQGVKWESVDQDSATATLRDGPLRATVLFGFDKRGLIGSVRAQGRARPADGALIPTAWEGRWSGYETRDGMRVPLTCSFTWLLPEGPRAYWRGHVKTLSYETLP